MHYPVVKFVMTADMIEMRVAGDSREFFLGYQRHPFTQRDHIHPTIDELW